MNTTMQTIFGLAGGLAMFLFGMNMMSESLQKVAGEKMKAILAMLTKNPVLGVIAGALVTTVLQSSSATTVMTIGFVSAGLMTLPQAISVILGANIGTTMTAQLMAFKISDYIWLIVFIGFIISFVSKKEKIKNIGTTIFAFGVLFVGIETMGSAMKPLANSPVFTDMIAQVANVPILGVGVGAVMTLIVQSSSATIAVLQNFASQAGPDGVASIIGLTGAIPILLGDNIGTTITALLASIGQSKNAKRTAIAHSVFNISGSMVFICIIPLFAQFVTWISPKGPELEVIARQIANAHTTFNIICTICWLPFIWVLVKIVKTIIRGEDEVASLKQEARYLDYKVINQSAVAISLVTSELKELAAGVNSILTNIQKVVLNNKLSDIKSIDDNCIRFSRQVDETRDYIGMLFASGSLTEKQTAYVSAMVIVLESIGNINKRCTEICELSIEKIDNQYVFTDDAKEEMKDNMKVVIELYDNVQQYLNGNMQNPMQEISKNKEKMIYLRNKARKNNAKRIAKKQCQKDSGSILSNTLFCLERISYDCFNMMGNDISPFNSQLDTVEK